MAAGFLIKGILIGLLFGIPVGAVGTLTAQRAYRYGFAAGIKTGLGSSAADCLYAACGAFGLTLVSDFLLRCQTVIRLAGGCLILVMGVRLFAFSYFGITGENGIFQGIQLVAGVFIGTFFWWCMLSAGVVFLRKKTGCRSFRYMNRVFGTILILFGTVNFIKTIQ